MALDNDHRPFPHGVKVELYRIRLVRIMPAVADSEPQ